MQRLFADLGTVVDGRKLEDDATVLLELEGGIRGMLSVSQILLVSAIILGFGSTASGGLDWSKRTE
ncbi:MAG: hypothetical protein Ct9H300mP15_00770 [Gemmatimonadota bacterium]|nr:MAG: hypothetical protein Ct9H300mP15_00770 [Gemmatimonadota bacterium]